THGFLLKQFEFETDRDRLHWARVTMLGYALGMGTLVFIWASQLFGPTGGLLALGLYCFNSNVLGHASLITTDIIYACFSLFLLYFFWRFMSGGDWRWVVAAGVSLGLALLSKYSGVLWFLVLPVVGAVLLMLDSRRDGQEVAADASFRPWGRFLVALVLIFFLALLVLNAGYGFRETLAPIRTGHYQSRLLSALSDNALTSWIPLPIPAPFMQGFESQKYISEVGHPAFLAGMHSTQGWWYYYLACFVLKMPAAFWPILGCAAVGLVREKDRKRRSAVVLLLISSLATIAANSFLSNSHAGFRYVFASVPPLFVLGGAAVKSVSSRWGKRALFTLAVLYVASALWVHPHHLAYFSELVGGPKNGYKWLSDSNLDWGQDLDHAREYVRTSTAPITVNPGMMPVSGRILINATTLQDCFVMYDIHGWLRPFKPIDYVGYSWLVFDITKESIKNRKRSPDDLPDECYLASFEYERDRLQETVNLTKAALKTRPSLPEALYLLGLAHLGLGDLDEAIVAFEAIPVSHPFYVDARQNLSFITALMGDKARSEAYRKQARIEATLRTYSQRPTVDVSRYSDSLVRAPRDWKLHNNLGVAFWAKGRLSEAEAHLRLAAEIQPKFVESLANLAIVLEEQARFDEALEALGKYHADLLHVDTMPYRDYRVYYQDTRVMLGDTLEIYPQADEHVLRLKAQLQKNPNDVWLLNQLSAALTVKGRFGEAYDSLSRAIALAPASSALYTNLALLYTEKKMFSHAVTACKQALELDPGSPAAIQVLSSVQKRAAD
ncbi:MAG: phospholipid carrier-dependent glycosyltransferase, partial [Candidatus Abyssobacteria bacterium SURF_17]